METLKFENLPSAVAELQKGQNELKALLLQKEEPQSKIEMPIQLDQVVPITGLTKPTLYGYVQRNEIPYHKKGNRLYFFKSEIIEWIKTGKQRTLKELQSEAGTYLLNKNKELNNGK
ncbi:helix-turn-helix domain-containing protein [uncultured Tenacibaculum sp.]|uniref:helix-turn-helix domain-containing protein n=1 Tax=uncultured Tenacibaculum sp. TaxID=174713 RepID=UPI0026103AAC|nr:helix-turn-helix domain-containing protein [uncultured Tenacibaculum sp.]